MAGIQEQERRLGEQSHKKEREEETEEKAKEDEKGCLVCVQLQREEQTVDLCKETCQVYPGDQVPLELEADQTFQVDIYGKCGNLTCHQGENNCFAML